MPNTTPRKATAASGTVYRIADLPKPVKARVRSTAPAPRVLITDARGTLVASDGMAYYLTPCCKASGKGSIADGTPAIVCRKCYREVDYIFGDAWAIRDDEEWANYGRDLARIARAQTPEDRAVFTALAESVKAKARA